MNDVINFILETMPTGVFAFGPKGIIFSNKQAEKFFKRHKLPDEIPALCGRIFDSASKAKIKELFPGEIYLHKKLAGSPSNWTFMFRIYERPEPCVCVFIIEEAVSNKLDLNKTRNQFRLTRRETDVLRRVLNGLANIEIAEDLNISEQTVKDHMSSVYMKAGVKNRFELASFLLNSPDNFSL